MQSEGVRSSRPWPEVDYRGFFFVHFPDRDCGISHFMLCILAIYHMKKTISSFQSMDIFPYIHCMGRIYLGNDTYWSLNIWFVIEHLLLTKAWFTPLEEWHPMTASRIMWSTNKSPFLRSPLRLKHGQQKPSICCPKADKTAIHLPKKKSESKSIYMYIYIYKSKFPVTSHGVFFPEKKNNMKRKAGSMYFFLNKNHAFDKPHFLKLLTRSCCCWFFSQIVWLFIWNCLELWEESSHIQMISNNIKIYQYDIYSR